MAINVKSHVKCRDDDVKASNFFSSFLLYCTYQEIASTFYCNPLFPFLVAFYASKAGNKTE